MGETTKISWTDHTFNPWIGCAKVSAGCAHCYAEHDTFPRLARADGHELWGPKAERHITSEAYWKQPLRWDRKAREAGVRRRVFCGSLCDVFEDRVDLDRTIVRLFDLMAATPHLDWLLLTKRPEHASTIFDGLESDGWTFPQSNVWLGVSVEDPAAADKRIPILLRTPAAVRFLSIEPLLGPVDLSRWMAGLDVSRDSDGNDLGSACGGSDLDWVIVGGESGPHARPCNVEWIRGIVRQCREAGVACFVKQLGADVRGNWDEFRYLPNCPTGKECLGVGDFGDGAGCADVIRLVHPKGGDPSEWPEDLRVQEFPR